jgi:hypothetical protein
MRRSHAATAWIFERLGLDVALAGDLLEECAGGRSIVWYWRQVFVAVWVGTWDAIFDHKLLALRAVITGCAANAGWLFLWQKFLHFGRSERPRLAIESIATLLIILVTQTATGWIIARTHRTHAMPMVFVFATWLVLWYPAGVDFRYLRMLMADSIDQPRFRGYLAADIASILVPILVEIAGLLVGGVVGARPKKRTSEPALS